MAGSAKARVVTDHPGSANEQVRVEHNLLVADLETVRAALGRVLQYVVENLAAGADIAARAIFRANVALTVQDSVYVIPEAASAGVDGSNTLTVTLRNITEGVDIASVVRTTNLVANTPVQLTLEVANADIAAGDVLGLVVTQGAAADAGAFTLQYEVVPQTVDVDADLLASTVTKR